MTSLRLTVTAWLTIAGVLFIGLLFLGRWPTWASVLVAAVVAAAGLLLTAARSGTTARPVDTASITPVITDPPAPVYQSHPIAGVLLPSNRVDYSYVFSATVRWQPVGAPSVGEASGLGALAASEIVRRAREFTRRCDPADPSLTWMELVSALAHAQVDVTGKVRAMAEAVQLTLPEPDRQRLDKMAALRKDEEIWDYEIHRERSRRRYLSEDVLRDPGSALVWWLARNDGQVEKAAASIGVLAQLANAANGASTTDGEATQHPDVAGNGSGAHSQPANSPTAHLGAFMESIGIQPGTDRHQLFTAQIARLVGGYGHEATADETSHLCSGADNPVTHDDDPDAPARADD